MSLLPCPGDRIRLVRMEVDPDPIEPGSEGTVREVNLLTFSDSQLWVDWDNGRSLSLLVGVDEWEIIGLDGPDYIHLLTNSGDGGATKCGMVLRNPENVPSYSVLRSEVTCPRCQ